MKTLDEFKNFYSTALMSDLQILEARRKKIAKNLIILILVVIAIMSVSIAIVMANKITFSYITVPSIICVGILAFGYFKIPGDYNNVFKDKIIEPIIKFIDPHLNYNKKDFISESEFRKSNLFLRQPDRYKGDDYVSGTLDKTAIRFSEIHAEYKTESRDNEGRKQTSWHNIFKGLFFIGDFNKHFKGVTVVLPDKAEKLFGGLGKMLQKMNIARGELIKLEDPEFEKLFAVYGDDQVEARYILSTSLMRRITEFKKKSKKNIFISFVASNIYLAVAYKKDLFEAKLFKSLLKIEEIQEYFEDLQLAIGIVEELNLNTRIWSKQ